MQRPRRERDVLREQLEEQRAERREKKRRQQEIRRQEEEREEERVKFAMDCATLDDAAQEFEFTFVQPLRLGFSSPCVGNRMQYSQVLLYCAALFRKHLGATWPLKVRFVMVPNNGKNFQWQPDLVCTLPPASLGVALLSTEYHWAGLICLPHGSFLVDGRDTPGIMEIAEDAHEQLKNLQCPAGPLNLQARRFFSQVDSWSCGYQFLAFLDAALGGYLKSGAPDAAAAGQEVYRPPQDWQQFLDSLQPYVSELGCKPLGPEVIHDSPQDRQDDDQPACQGLDPRHDLPTPTGLPVSYRLEEGGSAASQQEEILFNRWLRYMLPQRLRILDIPVGAFETPEEKEAREFWEAALEEDEKRRSGMRWEPPALRRFANPPPVKSLVFLKAVAADHFQKDLLGDWVVPRVARINSRADVETNMTLVVALLKAGKDTCDVLRWATVLHLIHCREATATVMSDIFKSGLTCSRDVVAGQISPSID